MLVDITVQELVACIDYEYLDFHPMRSLGGSSGLNSRCSNTRFHRLNLHYLQSIPTLYLLGIDHSCGPFHNLHKMLVLVN